jgi:hypothetical protein
MKSEKERIHKIVSFARNYLIPVLALIGLFIGRILQASHEEQAGKIGGLSL